MNGFEKMNFRCAAARWLGLVLGLALVWLFVFVAAPRLQKVGAVAELHGFVRERGIDATALYYTDAEEFCGADVWMRDSRAYGPD